MSDNTPCAPPDAVLFQSIRKGMAGSHQVSGTTVRSQHPKSHGVLQATFQVHELPEAYRVGVFAVARPIAAWIRFSNGRERDDRHPDVRGLAIKLLDGATDSVAPDGENASTQDFVLADHPVFFAKDAPDFLRFMALKGKQGTELASTPIEQQPALKAQQQSQLLEAFPKLREFLKIGRNPFGLSYFSQTPYRFGERCVKYFARPEGPAQPDVVPASPDALRDSMVRLLTTERTTVRLSFGIEVHPGPDPMPIEDATTAWDSPEQVVLATITIPPQEFASEERQAFGEALSFAPWHARPAHEPLGSINRARRDAYIDSSATRHEVTKTSQQAPTESDFNFRMLSRFFESFRGGDVKGMRLCLHPDVEFRDIGFDLRGREVGAMWDMIVSNGIVVSYRDLQVAGQAGTAHWECDYQFRKEPGSTPRPVHNIIDSKFRFEGGLIRSHEDACDFWSWIQQAMGPLAAGARAADFIEDTIEQMFKRDVPIDVEEKVRAKVKEAARGKITAFIGTHPEYAA